MENSKNTPEEENHILRKINLQFRKEKLAPELKQKYILQALQHYHNHGNISQFEFIPPKDTKKNQNYTIQKGDQTSSKNTSKKELTSFKVRFDKNGNAIAKDNQGNTLPPASPEEVFKKIIQKFKASGAKKLNIKAPNGKKDERISGIFAKECIMSGIAPHGDLPKSPAFWKALKKEFLDANHTPEEWRKLTGNVSLPQAGIFVKKDRAENDSVKKALKSMINSVRLASTNPKSLVKSAVKVDKSLNKIGEETLNNAVGKCNLRVDTNQKDAIEFYFTKVMDLGLGKTVGGKLPDEGFYYQK